MVDPNLTLDPDALLALCLLPPKAGIARTIGVKWYFTGRPCVNGHYSARNTNSANCLQCTREMVKKLRDADPERHHAYNLAYGLARPDYIQSYALIAAARRRPGSELATRYNSERRLLRAAEPERFSAYDKRSYAVQRKTKPIVFRVKAHRRRTRKKLAGGFHTEKDIAALWLLQDGRCAVNTSHDLNDLGFHVDHWMPLALGGTNSVGNLRLLCPTCNLRKSKKDPADFLLECAAA